MEFVIDSKRLMAEWNTAKNTKLGLDPSTLLVGSGKKAWWKCEKGHEWQAPIYNRNNGRKCPICTNRVVLSGFNDLATINPAVAKEWDYEKNGDLRPEDVLSGSRKKAWWKCSECGHEWETHIYLRHNHGCPKCGIAKVGKANSETTDGHRLTDVFPDVTKCWDYKKNGDLRPEDVAAKSNMKVWWKCSECGHEWQALVYSRARHHRTTCRKCSLKTPDRIFLKPGINDFATVYPSAAKEWNYEKNGGLKPEDVTVSSDRIVWWKCEKGHEWETRIRSRSRGSKCPYCSNMHKRLFVGINDLASTKPELAKEWNYEKNGDLKPEEYAANSNKKVWWKCEKGHEWEASGNNRFSGRGCPYCSNNKVLIGYNDLVTTNPELAKEWNYEKNDGLKPEDVVEGSHYRVWWKCSKCGHEWQTSLSNRERGTRCPVCTNRVVLSGVNSLSAKAGLVSEWDYCKNSGLSPDKILASSSKKVWWKCSKCGYEWQASPAARQTGHRCPACTNKTVAAGINDLATTHPKLAKEWNYEKNGDLRPENVVAGSSAKVWWKCEKGHEWEAVIVSRKKNANCPVCAAYRNTSLSEKAVGYYLLKYGVEITENKKIGRKELDIFIPSIKTAIEYDGKHYHADKQKDLVKNKLCRDAGIKLIRLRESGLPILHSSSIDVRVGDTRNSYVHLNEPIKEVLTIILGNGKYDVDLERDYGEIYERYQKGTVKQSFADMYNNLLLEWDYEKNTVDPKIIPAGSHYKAWWKCSECGHEWQAPVYSRAHGGTGCQLCGYRHTGKHNARLKDSSSSLAVKYPLIAKEWNFERNDGLKPEDVAAQSNKRVWWKCSGCGYEWQTAVCNRTRKGEPLCLDCKYKERMKNR